MSTRDEIIEGAANCAWCTAWQSAAEERRSEGGSRLYGMGSRIEDCAPPRPKDFDRWAEALVSQIEADIRKRTAPLDWTIEDAFDLIPGDKDNPARFGECLAYESMGDGIAWDDDNEPHGLRVPLSEVYVHLGPRSGKPVNWYLSVGNTTFNGGRMSK